MLQERLLRPDVLQYQINSTSIEHNKDKWKNQDI